MHSFIIREKRRWAVKNKQGVEGAARLIRAQLLTVLVMSITVILTSGLHSGASVFLGGLVSVLPTAYFAKIAFRYNGACAAQQIVNCFYKGEAIKMLLTFSLFALIFKTLNIVPLAFIVGFIVAQMMFWFAPLIFDNKRK
jgi:ATP synthase protein I